LVSLEKRIFIGVTGASGSIYAQKLIHKLWHKVDRIYLVFSKTAPLVISHELSSSKEVFCLFKAAKGKYDERWSEKVRIFSAEDLFAPIASGSSVASAGVIIPCSAGTLARIAHGISSNLIERSADVLLKQKKPLIIGIREAPLNRIHLKNMLELDSAGASILPLAPGFYHKPKDLDELTDFIVGKVLELLGFEQDCYPHWNTRRV
jgi:4-hydroxy-3-polyprenylbenzoate decarboxylase